jgi:hypothetical protein
MKDAIFNLFIEVLQAAAGGRFCHGNGAQWCVVDKMGNSVVIDTQAGTVTRTARNPIEPHSSNTVVRMLEDFLLGTEVFDGGFITLKGHGGMSWAAREVLTANMEGRILHWNGGQCHVVDGFNNVQVYDLCVAGEVRISSYGKHASWKYLQANGNKRQKLGEESLLRFRSML